MVRGNAASIYTLTWVQSGGGCGGHVPPLFQTLGYNMLCTPTFFSLGFISNDNIYKNYAHTVSRQAVPLTFYNTIAPVHLEHKKENETLVT